MSGGSGGAGPSACRLASAGHATTPRQSDCWPCKGEAEHAALPLSRPSLMATSDDYLFSVLAVHHSEATGIRLTDSLPADAKLMSGSLGASFAKLAVGGHATHTYVIVPAEGDKLVTLPSAAVEYIAEKEASGKQVRRSVTTERVGATVSRHKAYWTATAAANPASSTTPEAARADVAPAAVKLCVACCHVRCRIARRSARPASPSSSSAPPCSSSSSTPWSRYVRLGGRGSGQAARGC